MTTAATLSLNWMTDLFAALPDYHEYHSRHAANGDETKFRLALGQQLQVIGQHLLAGSESRVLALGDEQHEIIDLLADDVGDCLKMLNRTGSIQLAADIDVTIGDLEAIDSKLLLLLERLWCGTMDLYTDQCGRFGELVRELAMDLQTFLDLAEERNSLMGLGWESEFGLRPGRTLGYEGE